MALSSNGAILASAASGREVSGTADICLWNTDTGICTAVLSYHPSAVHAVDFTQVAILPQAPQGANELFPYFYLR
jgi:WD40 repeat protein